MPQQSRAKICLVAGASRGAGRGAALALGDAGATVYVAARSRRGGPGPNDGAPGTVEDTAEAVTARGGVGIAVTADCTDELAVAALFERIEREQGRLDVLVNAVWGAADAYSSSEAMLDDWGKPFWELPTSLWGAMMRGGPYAYYLCSVYAARLMAKTGGLIVSVTDGVVEGATPDDVGGQLLWDLAHSTINHLMRGMSQDGKPRKIAAVTLMPGFMRTERVVRALKTDELKRMFKFDRSESTEYLGRAVAALANDSNVMAKTGKIHFVADLAGEYGFTDADGKRVPRFSPVG
jgi:NAD(P)-dependent dehydrogenase (short-subunit alcohol dehydrogenase family)